MYAGTIQNEQEIDPEIAALDEQLLSADIAEEHAELLRLIEATRSRKVEDEEVQRLLTEWAQLAEPERHPSRPRPIATRMFQRQAIPIFR
jgi:hypothetical protein